MFKFVKTSTSFLVNGSKNGVNVFNFCDIFCDDAPSGLKKKN